MRFTVLGLGIGIRFIHDSNMCEKTVFFWSLLYRLQQRKSRELGGVAHDNRQFINAIFLDFGAPWRDLPPYYGYWKNTHRRFCRWRDKGIWESLLEKLVDDPDFEWLMIETLSHIKAHTHTSGAKGGNQDMDCTKGGSTRSFIWPWMRMSFWSEFL